MSLPWRFRVVGSWTEKKTRRRSANDSFSGSNLICATSACPVVSEHTSWYVGLSLCPPEYPETTSSTPTRSSKTASTHQKQPAAKVAVSKFAIPPILTNCVRVEQTFPISFGNTEKALATKQRQAVRSVVICKRCG